MSDPINDKELDEYLAGGSAVSRRYRELGAADVPAELDRLVLQRARAEVARPSRAQKWRRWSVPVALAASVVLVVTILIEPGIREQSVEQATPVHADAATAAAPAESSGAVAREEERKSEIAGQERDLSSMTAPVREDPASDAVDQIARGLPPQSSSSALAKETVPPQLMAPTQEVTTTATRAASGDVQGSPVAAISVAPQVQVEPPAPELRGEIKSNAIEQTAASTTDAAAAKESGTSYDLSEVTVTGARRARSATGGVGPRNTIPPRATYSLDENTVAGGAAPAAAAAANQAPAPAAAPPHDDPVRWLDTIRQLRKDGKVHEADEEWERFRAAFPDYAVGESDPARPPKH